MSRILFGAGFLATLWTVHASPLRDLSCSAELGKLGVTITALSPLGAEVRGIDLRKSTPEPRILQLLQSEMAERGFIVFRDQGVMSPEEQCRASELWGGREMHSTHGVHPATPNNNQHIFRLSNDRRHGTLGVGPQWHNDGSFVSGTFSHVGYHIIRPAENGGGTFYAHQGLAFDALPADDQERWQRLVSVNSNSGVAHPVVHEHPISGRKSVWLHLGMTGAVMEHIGKEKKSWAQFPKDAKKGFRLLTSREMTKLFHQYNDLLNAGMNNGYAVNHEYQAGDLVMIDNLAIAHKAAPESHQSHQQQGTRILHRTTVKAMQDFKPPFGLPQHINIQGPNPLNKDGIWAAGGIGFRWDENIHMQN